MEQQKKKLKQNSKYLSLILRHKPEVINLELDDNGWGDVTQIMARMPIVKEELEEIVETNDKQRFEFNEDHSKIRARQGHSLDVDVELEEKEPPVYLYHGTTDKVLNSIKEKGLISGSRQYVHLSEDRETAAKVGKRHGGKLVILRVRAMEYYDEFYGEAKFYLSRNGVWLTKKVPVDYLVFPADIEMKKTGRGFAVGEFTDRYGVKCSIQQSSLATENAIWLGCDEANPREMCSKAKNPIAATGWQPVEMPEDYVADTRMHLTEEMVIALIEKLQNWVDTGNFNGNS